MIYRIFWSDPVIAVFLHYSQTTLNSHISYSISSHLWHFNRTVLLTTLSPSSFSDIPHFADLSRFMRNAWSFIYVLRSASYFFIEMRNLLRPYGNVNPFISNHLVSIQREDEWGKAALDLSMPHTSGDERWNDRRQTIQKFVTKIHICKWGLSLIKDSRLINIKKCSFCFSKVDTLFCAWKATTV